MWENDRKLIAMFNFKVGALKLCVDWMKKDIFALVLLVLSFTISHTKITFEPNIKRWHKSPTCMKKKQKYFTSDGVESRRGKWKKEASSKNKGKRYLNLP